MQLFIKYCHLVTNNKHWTVQINASLVLTSSLINVETARHMLRIPTLFLFPSLQISMSVRGRQTVRGAAVSTVWAHTTVSARRATHWLEAGDVKVSLFKLLSSFLLSFAINVIKSGLTLVYAFTISYMITLDGLLYSEQYIVILDTCNCFISQMHCGILSKKQCTCYKIKTV